MSSVSCDDESYKDDPVLVNVLKDYVVPEDYKIYDFDKIIKDSKCRKGILAFDLHTCILYLKREDYSFYDVEPEIL